MTTVTEPPEAGEQPRTGKPWPPPAGTGPTALELRQAAAIAKNCNPADGVGALCLLSDFHQHYDYWEAPEFADVLAAWEMQNAATLDDGSPIWRAVPRIIVAGMHGTGKDGTMAQIAAACDSSVLMKVTYPGIRDCIAQDREAAILNEAQATFGPTGAAAKDVRVVVNAHVKGNTIRDGRHGKMNVFGQVAMAGLPKLLTGKLAHEIEDTLSRCFILWKNRKPKGYIIPEMTDAAEDKIRKRLVPRMREWCAANREDLRARAAWFGAGNPTGLPDLGGGGRGNDQLARPLLAVCDVATAMAYHAWCEMRAAGKVADDAKFPAEWNWAERIRKAIVFVSGVPEITDDEDAPLGDLAAEFGDEWAEEGNGDSEDILAALGDAGQFAPATWDGQVVSVTEDDDAPAPPQDTTQPPPEAPSGPTGAVYNAAQATTYPDDREPGVVTLTGFATLPAAKTACEALAGGPLDWNHRQEAVTRPEGDDGPEIFYAVRLGSEEERS